MSDEMAAFIAEWVMREISHGRPVDHYTILDAEKAFKGDKKCGDIKS